MIFIWIVKFLIRLEKLIHNWEKNQPQNKLSTFMEKINIYKVKPLSLQAEIQESD